MIIDEVAREANTEKIKAWKNATIRLATDYSEFEFKDNFFRILSNLTIFDLTVLHNIYSNDYTGKPIANEVIKYFKNKGMIDDYTVQSLKKLAVNGLIDEKYMNTFTFAGLDDGELSNFIHSKNNIGQEFINFVMDIDDKLHSRIKIFILCFN